MATTVYNTTWAQGEDFQLVFLYKKGPVGAEEPVNLTGYSLRMDIVTPTGTRLYTFNSDDITDVDPGAPTTPDTTKEAVLGTNGVITITVPRSLTLPPNGVVYTQLVGNPPQVAPQNLFNYDVFLRDPQGLQKKILRGQVTVEMSYTIWT